jgi:hypothetical protein
MEFKIEIGKLLKNGSECLAVCRFAVDQGVVLADWEGKYVVWSFNTTQEDSTVHGSYFTHDNPRADDAWEEACYEFKRRIDNGM